MDSSTKKASFNYAGILPCEDPPPPPNELLGDVAKTRSTQVQNEGFQAVTNDDFSTFHTVLDLIASGEASRRWPEFQEGVVNVENLALFALVLERLAHSAITSTLAAYLKSSIAEEDNPTIGSAEHLCWLGYVLGRRVASEGRRLATEEDFYGIVHSLKMNQKGKRRSEPWNNFISVLQMEQLGNNDKLFTPARFIKHLGGEDRAIEEPNGTYNFILSFSNPECADLPSITRTQLMQKVKEVNKSL